MWNDRLAVLVEEIEEGLRDEEVMYDTNDDEFSKVSECISYNSETFEGRDTLTRPVSSGEETEPRETAENNDKKPLYPEATAVCSRGLCIQAPVNKLWSSTGFNFRPFVVFNLYQ